MATQIAASQALIYNAADGASDAFPRRDRGAQANIFTYDPASLTVAENSVATPIGIDGALQQRVANLADRIPDCEPSLAPTTTPLL